MREQTDNRDSWWGRGGLRALWGCEVGTSHSDIWDPRAGKGPGAWWGGASERQWGTVGAGQSQRLMQQALFSPEPGPCPAWALPKVMALVRVLFCLCLDTLAKISEGRGQ